VRNPLGGTGPALASCSVIVSVFMLAPFATGYPFACSGVDVRPAP